LSVVAILGALITQVTLGLFASDTDGLESGPLSRYVSYEVSKDAGELHEAFFKVLLVLIGLHIAAIALYLIIKRTNLIGPMFTGKRSAANAEGPAAGVGPMPLRRFAIGVALALAAVWLVVR